jgi:hypothetical protein
MDGMAPNDHACSSAPAARLAPLMPRGKPRQLRISELLPACPPMASRSSSSVVRPSLAAYTAADSTAGPALKRVLSRVLNGGFAGPVKAQMVLCHQPSMVMVGRR